MSHKITPIFILLAVLLLVGLLFLLGGGSGKNFNWWEHYRPESKDPYGTYIVHNLMKSYMPGESFTMVEKNLTTDLPKRETSGNYIFIGSMLLLDSAQTVALLRFVERGNTAFIASPNLPYELLDSISRTECLTFSYQTLDLEETQPGEEDSFADSSYTDTLLTNDLPGEEPVNYFEATSATLDFIHPNLATRTGYPCRFLFKNEPASYNWDYLSPGLFCEGQTVFASLGTLNGDWVNFAKASYGKGTFYLHTTPLAFSNLHVKDSIGLEYAAKAFSHLSKGAIYWDNTRPAFPGFEGNRGYDGNGPLQYILSQPSLAWAWYILLALALLYLIFGAKRKQRTIPVLEQNANTSLEFTATIGRLYFLQNNHKQLALQKMRLFLGFVRERYNLPVREQDGQFVQMLSTRSEVPEEFIGKIVRLHSNISSSGFVSENTLIDFHRLLEGFYQKCK